MSGRGATSNPPNRFVPIHLEPDPDFRGFEDDPPGLPTIFYRDSSRSAITTNKSPDLPFEASLNPYRGCEHGCAYCYARPTHEYLGFSAGLDFETHILVKEQAPELLRAELKRPGWKPKALVLSGVTDPYQPVERRLKLTRRCLEVLAEFHHPVQIITKNHLVTRDLDLLGRLAQVGAVTVSLSLTTLDGSLARRLEPRASAPGRRLAAIEALSKAGIPVSVMLAPVIPGLNDHEMPELMRSAASAGARAAGYVLLRLPGAVAGVFSAWLEEHLPAQKEKILKRIRRLRGGELNQSAFHARFRGEGPAADQLHQLFELGRRRAGLEQGLSAPSTACFRVPDKGPTPLQRGASPPPLHPRQLGLFDGA